MTGILLFSSIQGACTKTSDHNLKILRTDHRRKFNGEGFDNLCKNHGIKRELTVRQTQLQNGVAERKKYNNNQNGLQHLAKQKLT